MGTETVLLVGGGEPTLHPRFGEILSCIKDLGMHFNLSTNGTLLDKYIEHLVAPECGSITVSISAASRESFRLLRPHSNTVSLKKIQKNVRALAKARIMKRSRHPEIIALYAICKLNFEQIPRMAFHARKIGADVIWYQLVHLENFSRDHLYMTPEEMDRVKRLLDSSRWLSKILRLKFHSFVDFELAHYDQNKGDWSSGGLLEQGCYVGWHFTFVHIMKEVFMCCGAKVVGILGEDGSDLRDIWYSDSYRRYRNDALIMHKENPLTLYGQPLYNSYCDSCDNHDQNNMMIDLLLSFDLMRFVQR
jgi:MoaA/NifB/PqqE/SkfB family radical SAM enzyme